MDQFIFVSLTTLFIYALFRYKAKKDAESNIKSAMQKLNAKELEIDEKFKDLNLIDIVRFRNDKRERKDGQ
jgi:hypothetical protein